MRGMKIDIVAPRIFFLEEIDSRPWVDAVSLRPSKGHNGRYRCIRNHRLCRDWIEDRGAIPYQLGIVKAIRIHIAARGIFNILEIGSRYWMHSGAMM